LLPPSAPNAAETLTVRAATVDGMSEPTLPASPLFDNPASVPVITGQPPGELVSTDTPGQVGGSGQAFTAASTAGQVNADGTPVTQQIALTGEGNRLNLSGGAAQIAVTGGGQIVESAQLLGPDGTVIPDAGKVIRLFGGPGTFDDGQGFDPPPYNGGLVDTNAGVSGNDVGVTESVLDAAGGQLGRVQQPDGSVKAGFAFYAHGGSGNDVILGSFLSDFIRGGGGNDDINAAGGDDLVRLGTGSDTAFLGQGQDTLYYTLDQIDSSIDRVTDFASGIDKVSYAAGITATIVDGGRAIQFTAAGGLTTRLESASSAIFQLTDLRFLG